MFGQWIFKIYSGSTYESYPPYIESSHPDIGLNALSQSNRELKEQLVNIKGELLKLEESEQMVKNQKLELKTELDQVKLAEFKEASPKAISPLR